MRRNLDVGTVADEVAELFINYQRRYDSDIALELLNAQAQTRFKGRGRKAPDRWRRTEEFMTLLLYFGGLSEEEIGSFSCPSSSPGISQQAVSKRLKRGIELIERRFGGSIRETPHQVRNQVLIKLRAELYTLVNDFIRQACAADHRAWPRSGSGWLALFLKYVQATLQLQGERKCRPRKRLTVKIIVD